MSFFSEFLVKLINLPHELWKHSNENSGIGTSEFEEETERGWAKVSIAVGVLIGLVYLAWNWLVRT